MTKRYAFKHTKHPDKRVNSCRGEGGSVELVESDAGYVGGFDVVGCVIVFF